VTSRDEELLADLLLRWEELLEEGVDQSASELALERPDLAPELDRRIGLLKASSWLDKPLDDWGGADSVSRSPRPIVPSEPASRRDDSHRSGQRRGNPGRSGLRRALAWASVLAVIVALAAGAIVLWQQSANDRAHTDEMVGELMTQGLSHFFHAQYGAAEATFSAVLQISPTLEHALIRRGICRLKLGRYEDAIHDFSTVVQHRPVGSEALRNRAEAYIHLRRYDEAIADLETLIAAGPSMEKFRPRLEALRALRDKGEFLDDPSHGESAGVSQDSE